MKKNAKLSAGTPVVCTKYAPILKVFPIAYGGYDAETDGGVPCSNRGLWMLYSAKDIFVLPEEEAWVRQAVEDSIRKKIQQHEKAIAKLRATSVDQILADAKEEHRKQKGDP